VVRLKFDSTLSTVPKVIISSTPKFPRELLNTNFTDST